MAPKILAKRLRGHVTKPEAKEVIAIGTFMVADVLVRLGADFRFCVVAEH